MGTITVPTPISDIRFQVVLLIILFLLCLNDMDRLNVTFDNIKNVLYQGDKRFSVLRKWGYSWLLFNIPQSMIFYLSKTELRQFYRRFKHLSTRRLIDLFNQIEEEFDPGIIKCITEFCH